MHVHLHFEEVGAAHLVLSFHSTFQKIIGNVERKSTFQKIICNVECQSWNKGAKRQDKENIVSYVVEGP